MWRPLAADTQTITIKSQKWNFGSQKSPKVFYNQQLWRELCTITCFVRYLFITDQYVNSEYLFIHGIPEAILDMLAAENDADDW